MNGYEPHHWWNHARKAAKKPLVVKKEMSSEQNLQTGREESVPAGKEDQGSAK